MKWVQLFTDVAYNCSNLVSYIYRQVNIEHKVTNVWQLWDIYYPYQGPT